MCLGDRVLATDAQNCSSVFSSIPKRAGRLQGSSVAVAEERGLCLPGLGTTSSSRIAARVTWDCCLYFCSRSTQELEIGKTPAPFIHYKVHSFSRAEISL